MGCNMERFSKGKRIEFNVKGKRGVYPSTFYNKLIENRVLHKISAMKKVRSYVVRGEASYTPT